MFFRDLTSTLHKPPLYAYKTSLAVTLSKVRAQAENLKWPLISPMKSKPRKKRRDLVAEDFYGGI